MPQDTYDFSRVIEVPSGLDFEADEPVDYFKRIEVYGSYTPFRAGKLSVTGGWKIEPTVEQVEVRSCSAWWPDRASVPLTLTPQGLSVCAERALEEMQDDASMSGYVK